MLNGAFSSRVCYYLLTWEEKFQKMDQQNRVYKYCVPATSSSYDQAQLHRINNFQTPERYLQPQRNSMYAEYGRRHIPPLIPVQQTPSRSVPRPLLKQPEVPNRDKLPTQQMITTNQSNLISRGESTAMKRPNLPQNIDSVPSTSMVTDETQNNPNTINNSQFKIFGSTEREKMFVFTGTVERVMKWSKIFVNHFCYFEVIATVVSIQEGSVRQQKIMLLRDKKGPILQIVYYKCTYIDIDEFHVGKMLRCVGKMIGPNVLNAISIRNATPDEVETLERLSLICDQAVSHYLNV